MAENKIRTVQRFIRKHKVVLTVLTTSTAWFLLNRRNINAYNDFLRENGLYDAYWNADGE